MTFKVKSLKDRIEANSNGHRILIARYRPRYLSKSNENWTEWWRELAASKTLHKDYMKEKKIDWTEYKRRFLIEMKSVDSQKRIHELTQFVNDGKDITFLCHCDTVVSGNHCHRYLIRDLVENI
ncbi:MAG TPA: DUF488 family protein [Nitrososphaeraceae archaeon]